MRLSLLISVWLVVGQAFAQELMTAEQLLQNTKSEQNGFAAVLYVAGWRDGTSLQLVNAAADLREASDDVEDYATYQEVLGRCLITLGVADLVAQLNRMVSDDRISPKQSSARAALLDATVELCQPRIDAAQSQAPSIRWAR